MRKILEDFNDIACMGNPTVKPKHGFEHTIENTGGPIRSPCRHLDLAKLAAAKEYFEQMEAAGVCKRADSLWSLPLHIVVKSDGNFRPVETTVYSTT